MRNQGYAYTTVIGPHAHGQTLLAHLASRYPHSSAQQWQEKLYGGEVTIDGAPACESQQLAAGQTLVWCRPPWDEPEAPRHFELLCDDSSLLAVSKPSGLPTLPGGGFYENTLLRLVQRQFPEANPVHRLGRGTSGIVLFAKTAQAAAHLAANWNTPKIEKVYRALAQHAAEGERYEILMPIGRAAHPRLGWVWAASSEGKPSRSEARVVARGRDSKTGVVTTTFEVSLSSGRPHQIRIHLASIGHPLVGDPLYGAGGQPLSDHPGLPGDGGYLLHAQFLRFVHPTSGKAVRLEAALPAGFPASP